MFNSEQSTNFITSDSIPNSDLEFSCNYNRIKVTALSEVKQNYEDDYFWNNDCTCYPMIGVKMSAKEALDFLCSREYIQRNQDLQIEEHFEEYSDELEALYKEKGIGVGVSCRYGDDDNTICDYVIIGRKYNQNQDCGADGSYIYTCYTENLVNDIQKVREMLEVDEDKIGLYLGITMWG